MIRTAQLPILLLATLALTGCAGGSGSLFGPRGSVPVNVLGQNASTSDQQSSTIVAQVKPTDTFASATILNFIDPQAAAKMSEQEKTEAASAQFFALQFARPGVPRRWQGNSGSKGTVTAGPFVTVNDLNCRDFTHEITVDQTSYTTQGTACREGDNQWQVVNLSTG